MKLDAKVFFLAVLWLTIFECAPSAVAQGRQPDAATIAQRNATEKELESIAIIERKVMVPMRDGKRMQADIYRPKDESKKYPIIFVAHSVQLQLLGCGTGRAARYVSAAGCGEARLRLHRDERARPLFLRRRLRHSGRAAHRFRRRVRAGWAGCPGPPDKVGLIGCSSTAEWQLAVASRGDKALTTFIPESFGAGVGRVGSLLRAGQLVPRRRSADALRLVAL